MRGVIAIFAILLNAALPAGWELAFGAAGPFGGSYSVCLAGGGVIHEDPPPEAPPAAPAQPFHCHLCLLPGPAASATPQPASATRSTPARRRSDPHHASREPARLARGTL